MLGRAQGDSAVFLIAQEKENSEDQAEVLQRSASLLVLRSDQIKT